MCYYNGRKVTREEFIRLKELEKKEAIYQTQLQERFRMAKDLHDDIGATLNSVKIFTHLAETAAEKKRYFTNIKESLTQASIGLRDMIWVLDDAGNASIFPVLLMQTFRSLFSSVQCLRSFAQP